MIIFKNIKWKNLLSYGNYWTEVNLNDTAKTLIIGKNGSGKSTLIEAIVFALYNKAYRDINKPQLLNAITKKNLVVELTFDIGSNEYKIIRGIKPDIFEIYKDGVLIIDEGDYQIMLENTIIKKTYKTFCQVDILGSAKYTAFMELNSGDRRKVIEDLLDLHIFTKMNVIAKNKLKEINDLINENEKKYEISKAKLETYIKIKKSSTELYDEEIDIKTETISKNIKLIKEINKLIEIQENRKSSIEVGSKQELIAEKNKYVDAITKLNYNIELNKKDISFFEHNDSCPTCRQQIDLIFKNTTVSEKSDKISEAQGILEKIILKKDKVDLAINHIDEQNQILNSIQNTLVKLQERKNLIERENIRTEESIKSLKNKASANQQNNENDIFDIQSEITRIENELNDNKNSKKKINAIITSLKDTGVKALIIKEYIPVLNGLITKYLNKMDFMVSFELTETFEEIIKSRYRDNFSYGSFSEGQKFRINLALLFAFRDIAKARNSVTSNLLLMDEIFDSSLDGEGTDSTLSILKELTDTSNVIIISHKTDNIIDSFDRVLEFSLNKNFSQMKELT